MDQQRSPKDSLQYPLSDHWTSIDQKLAHISQLTQLEAILQPHLQSLSSVNTINEVIEILE